MTKKLMMLLCAGTLSLSACTGYTPNQNAAIGGLTGAAAGLAAADLADGSDTVKVAAALGGGAAGAAIGSNVGARKCTYTDGTPAPCPPRY